SWLRRSSAAVVQRGRHDVCHERLQVLLLQLLLRPQLFLRFHPPCVHQMECAGAPVVHGPDNHSLCARRLPRHWRLLPRLLLPQGILPNRHPCWLPLLRSR
ncbi:unnamed protein product, partial [Closterium sp. Naga37s-1]